MLKYEAIKGHRFKKRFFVWINIDFDDPSYKEYWWDTTNKTWRLVEDIVNDSHGCSTGPHCRNIKKFRRLMRKWREYMPKGTKFILVNRYDGFSARGKL